MMHPTDIFFVPVTADKPLPAAACPAQAASTVSNPFLMGGGGTYHLLRKFFRNMKESYYANDVENVHNTLFKTTAC